MRVLYLARKSQMTRILGFFPSAHWAADLDVVGYRIRDPQSSPGRKSASTSAEVGDWPPERL